MGAEWPAGSALAMEAWPIRSRGFMSGLLQGSWGLGFLLSFVVAYGSVAWFMAWVRRRGFAPFAAYRIVLGAAVLVWARHLGG